MKKSKRIFKANKELGFENKQLYNDKVIQSFIIFYLFVVIILLLLLLALASRIPKVGYVATSVPEDTNNIIEVSEEDINWELLEQLHIFDNEKFDGRNIIAPGTTGSYDFWVKNITNETLVYDVQFKDINTYGLHIKYKLKLENVYIAGDENTWVDVNDITKENIKIAPNSMTNYTLEWKWEDGVNDSIIAALDYAEYVLRIKIGAEIWLGNN